MTRVIVNDEYLYATANAIRDRAKTQLTYKTSEFADAIRGIQVPDDEFTVGEKIIDTNGTYEASNDGYDGYSSVSVAVPPPSLGTKTISSNGTYSAEDDGYDGYSAVTVAFSLGTKVVDSDGTYYAHQDGYSGYSSFTVKENAAVYIEQTSASVVPEYSVSDLYDPYPVASMPVAPYFSSVENTEEE